MVRTDWGSDLKFDAKSDRTPLDISAAPTSRHQGKRNFRHDEGVTQACTGTGAARALAGSQDFGRVTVRSLERWNQPGDDSGHAGNC